MFRIFLDMLNEVDILCRLAEVSLKKATNLSCSEQLHRNAICLKEEEESKNKYVGLEKVVSLMEIQTLKDCADSLKCSADCLRREAEAKSYRAFLVLSGYKSSDNLYFRKLLVFLQELQPKQAAKTLGHLKAIVMDKVIREIFDSLDEQERKKARKKQTNMRLLYRWKFMEFVVKNALFCESIKINHNLYSSTDFLGFPVALLQYQGKMSQMRSIAYEPLKMFKRRRLNLLTISAFLYFLCRKFLTLPKGHHYSPEMKKLLLK